MAIYLGALSAGLTMVSLPASSAAIREMHHLSDVQYGSIYLPQLASALLAALGGGAMSSYVSHRVQYVVALLAFAATHALLAFSVSAPTYLTIPVLLSAAAFVGLGFGLAGGPSNAMAAELVPRHATSLVTLLHTFAGAGLALGPVYFNAFAARGEWQYGPLGVLVLSLIAAVLLCMDRTATSPFVAESAPSQSTHPRRSGFFWLIVVAAVVYAIAEGTFTNWTLIYVHEDRGLPLTAAALALSAFFVCLTLGRLLISLLVVRVAPAHILLTLSATMILAAGGVAIARTGSEQIAAFGFAGTACSGMFPLLIAYLGESFPGRVAWMASVLVAMLLVGLSLGSYIVGALRTELNLSRIYALSSFYPVLIIMVLVFVRRSSFRRSAFGQRFMQPGFGRTDAPGRSSP